MAQKNPETDSDRIFSISHKPGDSVEDKTKENVKKVDFFQARKDDLVLKVRDAYKQWKDTKEKSDLIAWEHEMNELKKLNQIKQKKSDKPVYKESRTEEIEQFESEQGKEKEIFDKYEFEIPGYGFQKISQEDLGVRPFKYNDRDFEVVVMGLVPGGLEVRKFVDGKITGAAWGITSARNERKKEICGEEAEKILSGNRFKLPSGAIISLRMGHGLVYKNAFLNVIGVTENGLWVEHKDKNNPGYSPEPFEILAARHPNEEVSKKSNLPHAGKLEYNTEKKIKEIEEMLSIKKKSKKITDTLAQKVRKFLDNHEKSSGEIIYEVMSILDLDEGKSATNPILLKKNIAKIDKFIADQQEEIELL